GRLAQRLPHVGQQQFLDLRQHLGPERRVPRLRQRQQRLHHLHVQRGVKPPPRRRQFRVARRDHRLGLPDAPLVQFRGRRRQFRRRRRAVEQRPEARVGALVLRQSPDQALVDRLKGGMDALTPAKGVVGGWQSVAVARRKGVQDRLLVREELVQRADRRPRPPGDGVGRRRLVADRRELLRRRLQKRRQPP